MKGNLHAQTIVYCMISEAAFVGKLQNQKLRLTCINLVGRILKPALYYASQWQ
jgi:hypothetical protein